MTNSTRSNRKRTIPLCVCVTIAVLFYLAALFWVRPVFSKGTSMYPNVRDGQLLATLPIQMNPFLEPQRGDVVIVRYDAGDKLLIKRLIALPGDTLEIRDNRVYLNGTVLDEPYIYEQMVTKDVASFTLGEDMYYVLGDNRNISADSRLYGLFTKADIYAVVDLEHQGLHFALWLALVANVFIWAAFVPDWDAYEEDQATLPVGEAA